MERDRLEKQVELSFYKSRGPGGQRKNKRETAVKIVHIPTGITARATESRSQSANRELAFERLVKKLENRARKKAPRVPTKKPFSVKLREKEKKEQQSRKKKDRGKPAADEDI